jgi:hypothetical protein
MDPDGTGQTEFYGNNSWFPTTIAHARGIPGSGKLVAIATGHHTWQSGKLILVDPGRGTRENEGIQLLAPVRETLAERIDRYGQEGDQFQYPYPLDETHFLIGYSPTGDPKAPGQHHNTHFGLYFMDADGRRELLAWDAEVSCNQPVPLAVRPRPRPRASQVDYRKTTGTYYLQDVYAGPGLQGVPRGTIKRLRVIALDFRAAGIGMNTSHGPGGGALASTPVSIGNGSWDVKIVLGEADVHEDGSAYFTAPARTPVYFQALDAKGHAVQTMRSWSTLQPGERRSCVGCHESKLDAALPGAKPALALRSGPQELKPFYGPPRGFSFPTEIQPILDRHCIRCHSDRGKRPGGSTVANVDPASAKPLSPARSQWRYTTQDPGRGWEAVEFDSSRWATGQAGFGREGTPGIEIGTEWRTPQLWLRREFELAEDVESHQLVFYVHHDEDVELFVNGVPAASATGYTQKYVLLAISRDATRALKPGRNLLAAHCRQTVGGQGLDVALLDAGPTSAASSSEVAFSLLSTETVDVEAKRRWSDSYLALTGATVEAAGKAFHGESNALVNWVGSQSVPSMLPPYFAGAAKSGLLLLLAKGHYGAKLSQEELDKLACWVDLLVPYCGDYREANAWTEEEAAKYERYLAKRTQGAGTERANLGALVRGMAPAE